jgi:hypothetical protein
VTGREPDRLTWPERLALAWLVLAAAAGLCCAVARVVGALLAAWLATAQAGARGAL